MSTSGDPKPAETADKATETPAKDSEQPATTDAPSEDDSASTTAETASTADGSNSSDPSTSTDPSHAEHAAAQAGDGEAQAGDGAAQAGDGAAQASDDAARVGEDDTQVGEGATQAEVTAQAGEGAAQAGEHDAQGGDGTAQASEHAVHDAEHAARAGEDTARASEGPAEGTEGTAAAGEGRAHGGAEGAAEGSEGALRGGEGGADGVDGSAVRDGGAAGSRAEGADVPDVTAEERPRVGVVYEPDESPDGFPLEYGNIIIGLPKQAENATQDAASAQSDGAAEGTAEHADSGTADAASADETADEPAEDGSDAAHESTEDATGEAADAEGEADGTPEAGDGTGESGDSTGESGDSTGEADDGQGEPANAAADETDGQPSHGVESAGDVEDAEEVAPSSADDTNDGGHAAETGSADEATNESASDGAGELTDDGGRELADDGSDGSAGDGSDGSTGDAEGEPVDDGSGEAGAEAGAAEDAGAGDSAADGGSDEAVGEAGEPTAAAADGATGATGRHSAGGAAAGVADAAVAGADGTPDDVGDEAAEHAAVGGASDEAAEQAVDGAVEAAPDGGGDAAADGGGDAAADSADESAGDVADGSAGDAGAVDGGAAGELADEAGGAGDGAAGSADEGDAGSGDGGGDESAGASEDPAAGDGVAGGDAGDASAGDSDDAGEGEEELTAAQLAERLAAEQAAMALITALMKLRGVLAGSRLPLQVVGADEARQQQKAMLDQLDDYLLPRLVQLEAPVLAVVGGSTGAGKSTLVNTVIGKVVSEPGVLRPTTRSPVLIHHPADADWFVGDRVLPGMARTRSDEPGGMEDAGQLRLVAADTVPRGLAILDAPDIDSVVEANRDLATQLLAAADLWLFVTTAARYSDAVPWEFLQTASDRSTAVAVVLDRAPSETIDDITGHLAQMLLERGLGDSPLFSIQETVVDGNGMLPQPSVASIKDWLVDLAADAEARAGVVRRTLQGAVSAMVKTTPPFAEAVKAQSDTAIELRSSVESAYDQGVKDIAKASQDGTLLRGEVLARWQEFVGTGELLKGLQSNAGRLRDRLKTSLGNKPAETRDVSDAIQSGLESLLREHATAAAERAEKAWQATAPGRQLLAAGDAQLAEDDPESSLGALSPAFPDAAARAVREWQEFVLDVIRKEGGAKKSTARILEYGVNGLGLSLMVVVFARETGIPKGAEASAGAGSAVVGQRLLEAVFGDKAVQGMVDKAREDLDGKVHALMDAEFARYLAVLDQHPVDAETARLLTEAARAVEDCT
ncbi:AAA family ATPase [Kribbella jiaozuonensis]|uniref:AAA family ATPase n=1 Tax=Kribbella jiaozuonensis TaxID=2575441 RepID=UPI001F2E0CE9|nr:AAA family ATPase [Kribbella jiaozuonensis]